MDDQHPLLQPQAAHPLVVNFHGWNPATKGDTTLANGSFTVGVMVPTGADRGGYIYTTLQETEQLRTLAQELVDDPEAALRNWFNWRPTEIKRRAKIPAAPRIKISLDDLEL